MALSQEAIPCKQRSCLSLKSAAGKHHYSANQASNVSARTMGQSPCSMTVQHTARRGARARTCEASSAACARAEACPSARDWRRSAAASPDSSAATKSGSASARCCPTSLQWAVHAGY